MNDLTILIAIVGIPALVLATWFLGYGRTVRIGSADDVRAILKQEDPEAGIAYYLISNSQKSAIALTNDRRFLAARVMGQDVATRLVDLSNVSLDYSEVKVPRLKVQLNDPGFPDLRIICSSEKARIWMDRLNARA